VLTSVFGDEFPMTLRIMSLRCLLLALATGAGCSDSNEPSPICGLLLDIPNQTGEPFGTLQVGDSAQVVVLQFACDGSLGSPEPDAQYALGSTRPSVASITPQGVVRAHEPGVTLLTATLHAVSATYELTVEP
jgi:hypothetical protein